MTYNIIRKVVICVVLTAVVALLAYVLIVHVRRNLAA